MEDLSISFVRALCAANGYSVYKSEPDTDGWDIYVTCKGKPAEDSIQVSPSFHAQLKSSYSQVTYHQDGSITYRLEVKNYRMLIEPMRVTPLILIVFCMPEDEDYWVEQSDEWLKIRKRAYWISLKGSPMTDNREYINITIPSDHMLTKESLRDIMVMVSKQEEL